MTPIHISLSQNHMATVFRLTLSCAPAERLRAEETLRQCHVTLKQIEANLSEFLPQSAVYQLNHSTAGESIPAPAELIELLTLADMWQAQTDGHFDTTAKGTVRQAVQWDASQQTVRRLSRDCHLGFGAIGKGYSLDKIRTVVEREGFQNYCLNAGGSSQLLSGLSAPGEPWKWGWSWQRDEQGNPLGVDFTHSSGLPIAIGVSGMQEQGAHLISKPAQRHSGLTSALVTAPTAAAADALSTALFVAGWETAMHWQTPAAGTAMAAIEQGGVARWNGEFQAQWGGVQ